MKHDLPFPRTVCTLPLKSTCRGFSDWVAASIRVWLQVEMLVAFGVHFDQNDGCEELQ